METLDGTEWDIVISGTGLPQSLLALALSRSGRRTLHLDRNEYYGGNEAALSLSEAEEWASKHAGNRDITFSSASVMRPPLDTSPEKTRLASSRAYSIALAPQLVYARSNLPSVMVSSRTHDQLEFQAVGSWFIVDASQTSDRQLVKVPNGREDVFQDTSLGLKAKRSLMKFLRFVSTYQQQDDWDDTRHLSFPLVLKTVFGLPEYSHQPLLALALAPTPDVATSTETAVSRIARHARSMGIFGPGFSAVLPKWGGLAEISQVACRACAVGGGVYVLNKGVDRLVKVAEDSLSLELSDGESITTEWLIGSGSDLPSRGEACAEATTMSSLTRSISIVSSPLTSLFPRTSEGGVLPAGAVIHITTGSNIPPVYILVHSSESGECPSQQCVLYASVAIPHGFATLDNAIDSFLRSVGEQHSPEVLWKMQYIHSVPSAPADASTVSASQHANHPEGGKIVTLPPLSTDLALDDRVLDDVKQVWLRVTGGTEDQFMKFGAREGTADDD